jgi:hypothetical protein
VIIALQEDDDPKKRMYVVNVFPNMAPLPTHMADVSNRMLTLAFSNKSEKDLERAWQTAEIILLINTLDNLMDEYPHLTSLKEHAGYAVVQKVLGSDRYYRGDK